VNFKRILPSLDSFIDTMTRQMRRVGEQGGQRQGRDRLDSGCSTDSRQGPLNEAACMAVAAPKMNLAARKRNKLGMASTSKELAPCFGRQVVRTLGTRGRIPRQTRCTPYRLRQVMN
jgi:hypothetical protein